MGRARRPPFRVSVLDTDGRELWPLVEDVARIRAVPPVLLLATAYAESNLNPRATREGAWPDVSYGLMQVTVQVAGGLGIGNGQDTWANREAVRAAMYDRRTSLMAGAQVLWGAMSYATTGDWLEALCVYNAGTWGRSAEYREIYADNVARYEAAIAWAKAITAG